MPQFIRTPDPIFYFLMLLFNLSQNILIVTQKSAKLLLPGARTADISTGIRTGLSNIVAGTGRGRQQCSSPNHRQHFIDLQPGDKRADTGHV